MSATAARSATDPGTLRTADLTICSVTFGDRPLLELNRELTERLNDVRPVWRLVRNRPLQHPIHRPPRRSAHPWDQTKSRPRC